MFLVANIYIHTIHNKWILFFPFSGSFKVFDADLKELATFHHRKEEISDVKFSPSRSILCLVAKYLVVASFGGRKCVEFCCLGQSYNFVCHLAPFASQAN